MEGLISILQAALGIGLLIFVHELGHYLAARLAGVRVEVFSLGFGQRLVGFVRNGTDYRLSLFPLGGYVRVAGEDPTRREDLEPDDLYAQGFGARALFFSGGVIMNVLFALVAFPLVFHSGVEFTAPVVGQVDRGGAAWQAGIEPGDRIDEIAGKRTYSFENLLVEIALAGGKGVVPLRVTRGDRTFDVDVRPIYSDGQGIFEIGIDPANADLPLVVDDVIANSPAARAGLQSRDAILAVQGQPALGDAALRHLATVDAGDRLALRVRRGDQELDVAFDLTKVQSETPRIGVRPAQPRIAAIRPTPAVAALGLHVDDVVVAVDGRPFVDGFGDVIRAIGDTPTRVGVLRDGEPLELSAPLDAAAREQLLESVALGMPHEGVPIVPLPDSPVEAAGMQPGDLVTAIGDAPVRVWDDLVIQVQRHLGEPLAVHVRRGSEALTFTVAAAPPEVTSTGFTSVLDRKREVYRVDGFGAAIVAGFDASIDLVKQLYVTLKRLVTGDVSSRNLGGIVTISRVSYHAAQSGLGYFFYLLALLSINLAFINVLPIPVLDGGHLMFLLIERVKGSPVSATVINYSQVLGLVFVIALMLYVTYNDILRLL